MDQVKALFKSACKGYNKGKPHLPECDDLVLACLTLLQEKAEFFPYSRFSPNVSYSVFVVGDVLSRPVRPELFLADPATWPDSLKRAQAILQTPHRSWTDKEKALLNGIVYLAAREP